MQTEWTQLEKTWTQSHPARVAALNPPASEAQIADLERKLGVRLPAAFVECLRIHDGQKPNATWVFSGLEFLSTKRILQEWTVWNDLWKSGEFSGLSARADRGVKADWWNPLWIPVTYNGSGDHVCLDLDPENGGTYGQMIGFWHDDAARKRVALSFEEWFRKIQYD